MPPVRLFHRLAVVSFVVDTLLQAIALLEDAERSIFSPSAIYVAYSPHPYGPIIFLAAGVVLQVHWFLRIYAQPSSSYFQEDETNENIDLVLFDHEASSEDTEDEENPNNPTSVPRFRNFNSTRNQLERNTMQEPGHLPYLPFYILGTTLQAIDATMWILRRYDYCGALSLVNFILASYALFYILGGSKNRRFPPINVFTHLVVKIRIAVSVLYLWKSWGALDVLPPPGPTEGALTCIFFVSLTLSSGPDPTLGFLLAGVLTSFATGQHTNLGWDLMFGWISVTVVFFAFLDLIIGVESRRMVLGSPEKKNGYGSALVSNEHITV